MIVYRIEHPKSKTGPWRHSGWFTNGTEAYDKFMDSVAHCSNARYQPLFQLWGSCDIPASIKCGCPSIEALKEWFPKPVRQMLHKYGFKLVALSVKNPEIVTDNQVAFDRESAIILSIKTLRN